MIVTVVLGGWRKSFKFLIFCCHQPGLTIEKTFSSANKLGMLAESWPRTAVAESSSDPEHFAGI